MQDAWMKTGKGGYTPVTAAETQRMYRGYVPRGVRFVCPICRQPLTPAAMSLGSLQSPHFRHQSNNPTAQRCERFSSGYGGYYEALYQRMPLPMFIRSHSATSSTFVVEGGFRTPDSELLAMLSSSGAKLSVGTRVYAVNEKRFDGGITRIPFDEIGLNPSAFIALKDSPLPIQTVWGTPNPGVRALVFTRDEHTGQGRRVRSGESVEYGAPVYLLLPRNALGSISGLFDSSRLLGHVECRLGGRTLQVVSAWVPSKDGIVKKTISFLGAEGISVRECEAKLELLWPPSLMADGEVQPLLKTTKTTFALGGGRKGLFIHENTSLSDEPTFCSSNSVAEGTGSFVSIHTPSRDMVITVGRNDYSNSMLFGRQAPEIMDHLEAGGQGYALVDATDGVTACLKRSLSLLWLRNGLPNEVHDASGVEIHLKTKPGDIVRIVRKLGARQGTAVLSQILRFVGPPTADVDTQKPTNPSTRVRCRDVRFAMLRQQGLKAVGAQSISRAVALARRWR